MIAGMRESSFRSTAAMLALLPACASSTVEYASGKCLIDGAPASLTQVEERQSEMTQHVLSRQPILTAIVVGMVAMAIAGYLPRIFAILTARKAPVEKFSDRLRARIERYRAHPIRYFLLVGISLSLLITAGVVYVALDADKRASERALANLQFCHLALRSAADTDHLKKIQSTEREIRALVSKLPAADQRRARNIADQLAQQRLAATQPTDAGNEIAACTAKLDALAKDVTAIKTQLDLLVSHGGKADDVAPAAPEAPIAPASPVDAGS
jgi:hypothetical protein